MKILYHIHGYPPAHNAGAEWMVHHMNKWLLAHGHQIIVAIPDPGAEEFEGIKIIPEYARTHIRHYYKWADIIISHLDKVGKVINNIRAVDKPALFIMHNTHRYSMIEMIAHRSVMVFNSEYTKAVPWYGHKDSTVVYPPCPVDYYTTHRGGGKNVTLVNHNEAKGSKVFHALAKMLPEIPFLAVKGGYGYQEKEKIDNVTYMENSPKIQKVYQATKVILMPSNYESFGRVAVEAAASGIPTICTPTPGLKEALGEAGIYRELHDLQGWADEIKKLYEDKEYYKKRSELSRKRAELMESYFDPQMTAMVELMEKAIARKNKEGRL